MTYDDRFQNKSAQRSTNSHSQEKKYGAEGAEEFIGMNANSKDTSEERLSPPLDLDIEDEDDIDFDNQ